MKVATFNVNGVNGRLPRLLEWLQEARPDVACLQEIKTEHHRFPYAAIERAGYAAVVHGQRSHHGVAILARGAPPAEIRRGLPGDDDDRQARYLEAKRTASSSRRCTCRTATRSRGPGSTTSSPGSSGSSATRRR